MISSLLRMSIFNLYKKWKAEQSWYPPVRIKIMGKEGWPEAKKGKAE